MMTSFRFSILVFLLLQSITFWSQTLDTTIVLNPVKITANKENFLVGSKLKKLDQLRLKSISSSNLSDAIQRYFPVYIKSDAGGLATVRFRGTSAEHTAILFNGININSITLGQSNLSTIPVFIFDYLKVQYGSSASLYGTDAIGGSIQLENIPKWNKGFQLGLEQDFSSFNSYFSGVKAGFSDKKWIIRLKAYHNSTDNDFPFLNTAVKNFETNEFVKDTTRNSAQKNYGFLQELNFKISKKLFAYSKIWYDNNWRQIQPNMSANYYGGNFTQIENNHLRAISGLKYYNGFSKYTLDLGYIYDYQNYNKDKEQIISTKSLIANLNYYNTKLWKGLLNLGLQYKHINPDVYSYKESIKEDRFDVFASYKKPIIPNLRAILNFRESIVIGYKNNFAPSFGLDYSMDASKKSKFVFKSSLSKSYKIPTFNQRFWYPNGNPDILPETGLNYELGTNYTYTVKTGSFDLNITAYRMIVDNWIQWINSDIWRPVNFKQVKNTGLEVSLKTKHTIKKGILQTGLNYSYTKAIEVKSYNDNKYSLGKQLIYTPQNIANFYSSINFGSWDFQTDLSFTGKRYTETYKVLDNYWLWNIHLEKKFHFTSNRIIAGISIKNILNKSYQNQEYFAMPGINYQIKLKYNLNEE